MAAALRLPAAAAAAVADGFDGGGGRGGGGGRRSDIALKHDVVLLGHLDNGLGYYRFSYLGSDKAYVGVIAQEVQAVMPGVVKRGDDGYLRVDYRQAWDQVPHLQGLARNRGANPDTREDVTMTKLRLTQSCRKHAAGLMAAAILLLAISSASAQRVFQTPEDAATALANAIKSGATRDLLNVLGRDAEDIMVSGDEVADREARERFVGAWDAKHNVIIEGEKAFLVVGTDDFPMPIPLTRQKAGWKFDTAAGRLEILYRRIGRNELDAIQTCLAYVDAQNEYAEKDRTGAGAGVYAERIVSPPARKTAFTGPHPMAMQVRSANSSRRPPPKDTRPGQGARHITATTTGS